MFFEVNPNGVKLLQFLQEDATPMARKEAERWLTTVVFCIISAETFEIGQFYSGCLFHLDLPNPGFQFFKNKGLAVGIPGNPRDAWNHAMLVVTNPPGCLGELLDEILPTQLWGFLKANHEIRIPPKTTTRIQCQGTIGCTPNSVLMIFIVFSRDSWGLWPINAHNIGLI